MQREDIVNFKRLVGSTQWDINFAEFCRRAAFTQDSYSEQKWAEFQTLAKALAQFDDNTLSQILGVL